MRKYLYDYNRRPDVKSRERARRKTEKVKEQRRLYQIEYRKPNSIARAKEADLKRKNDPKRVEWLKEYNKQARWKYYHSHYAKNYRLRKVYGISLEEYNEIDGRPTRSGPCRRTGSPPCGAGSTRTPTARHRPDRSGRTR